VKGFYFDQEACIGCRACQIACIEKNGTGDGLLLRRVRTYETGTYPDARVYHYSSACNNCAHSRCMAVCRSGALYVDDEDDTVQHDGTRCEACGACVRACPFGALQVDTATGVVRKCDSCIDLRGKEDPACVSACPMRALEFGDIDVLRTCHPGCIDGIPAAPVPQGVASSCAIHPRTAALFPHFRELIV